MNTSVRHIRVVHRISRSDQVKVISDYIVRLIIIYYFIIITSCCGSTQTILVQSFTCIAFVDSCCSAMARCTTITHTIRNSFLSFVDSLQPQSTYCTNESAANLFDEKERNAPKTTAKCTIFRDGNRRRCSAHPYGNTSRWDTIHILLTISRTIDRITI